MESVSRAARKGRPSPAGTIPGQYPAGDSPDRARSLHGLLRHRGRSGSMASLMATAPRFQRGSHRGQDDQIASA